MEMGEGTGVLNRTGRLGGFFKHSYPNQKDLTVPGPLTKKGLCPLTPAPIPRKSDLFLGASQNRHK
jgi:hypothetical protein